MYFILIYPFLIFNQCISLLYENNALYNKIVFLKNRTERNEGVFHRNNELGV